MAIKMEMVVTRPGYISINHTQTRTATCTKAYPEFHENTSTTLGAILQTQTCPCTIFPRTQAGPHIQPGVWRSGINRGRALNTSQVSNISPGSWFTYWSSLTALHCLSIISCIMMAGWSLMSLFSSVCHELKLSYVLIVSAKYT